MLVVAFVRSIPDHPVVACRGDLGDALGDALGSAPGDTFAHPAVSDRIDRDLLMAADHVACDPRDHLFVCHDPDFAPDFAFCRHDCARNAHHAALLRETDGDIFCTVCHLRG